MPRTVIWVQETDSKPKMSLSEPRTHPIARKGVAFKIGPSQPLANWRQGAFGSSLVQKACSQLYKCLIMHPAIREELDHAIQTPQGAEHPIYFYLDPPEVDELPWETLHEAKLGFLALDSRWPIARLRVPVAQVKLEYEFSPPLRVVAILSAAGGSNEARVPVRDEWDRIYDALKGAGLDFRLRALVCEEMLTQHIKGLGDGRLEVAYVVDKDDLTRRLPRRGRHARTGNERACPRVLRIALPGGAEADRFSPSRRSGCQD